jgi:hypothetical protein
MKHELKRNGESVNDTLHKKIKKPHINMISAMIQVSADLFRSTSGVLVVSDTLVEDQVDRGDGILAVIINGTIYVAAAIALIKWSRSLGVWYDVLGQAIEVVCPQGIKSDNITWIEPTQAGQVAIVDMALPKKDISYVMLKETPR